MKRLPTTRRYIEVISLLWFVVVVSQLVLISCGRESAPTSPTQTNVPTASSTGENTGGVDVSTDSTSSPDSLGGSGIETTLGGNNKNDGYSPSDGVVDWVSVLNEANLQRNVFAIGYILDLDETTYFYNVGSGFAAGFSNVLWTNAHVVEAMENRRALFSDDTTFYQRAYRTGGFDTATRLSLENVRTIIHPQYNGDIDSEDVAVYIFSDEPFKNEPLPSLLPMRFVDELAVGQPVGTLGFPGELGVFTGEWWDKNVVPAFKDGTLSALRSLITDTFPTETGRLLQYNLTTTAGTSGSPVFDHMGFIVGINHAAYTNFVADTSGTVIGVNTPNASFAIRVDALHELIPPVYNSPANVRRVVSMPYPYATYHPFPE